MIKTSFHLCVLSLLGVLLLAMAGCQSYEPLPLNLDDHQARWNSRRADRPDVSAFARDFAKRDASRRDRYDPSDGLTLSEAEVVALFFNARLRTLRLEAGVALAGAVEAGRWQDPELSVDAGAILASISQPWFAAASIKFTIPLSGRPGVEKDKAFAEHRALWSEVVAAEWRVLSELRQEWFLLAATRFELELAEEQQRELQSVQEQTRGLLETGDATAAELRVFDIELLRQKVAIQRLKREIASGTIRIMDLLGLLPAAPMRLLPTADLPGSLPQSLLAAARERNVDLAVQKAKYDVAEQNLRLEIRKQYPDLTIGPSYEIEEGQSRIGLGFGIPIPIINLNRRGIAEARAARLASKSAFEGEYELLVSRIAVAENKLKEATETRELVERELIPLAARQLTEAKELARLAKFDAILLLEALRARYEAARSLLQARVEEVQARARLMELVGPTYTPLPAPAESDK